MIVLRTTLILFLLHVLQTFFNNNNYVK
jgi:hypothetical protein